MTDDRALDHFERNFKMMPWLAIPYEDENRKQSLKSRFGVCEIPTLVIISATDCTVVTYDGREAIMAGKNALTKWVELVNNKDRETNQPSDQIMS